MIFNLKQLDSTKLLSQLAASFRNLHLGSLAPASGSNTPKKRVGRGRGAGGRFCGRGAAGQKSRSGAGMPRGFAGGQTPLHISTPKYGFTNAFHKEFSLVNLGRLQHLIDTKRIDPSQPITLKSLHDAGIKNMQDGVKILAGGREFFKSKIFIEATQLSQEAIARIEELEGTAIAVHHTKLSLKALTRPYLFRDRFLPRSPAPVNYRERLFYSDPKNRGYLVEENWKKCAERDLEFEARHVKDDATPLPEPPVPFKTFLLKKFEEQERLKKEQQ